MRFDGVLVLLVVAAIVMMVVGLALFAGALP